MVDVRQIVLWALVVALAANCSKPKTEAEKCLETFAKSGQPLRHIPFEACQAGCDKEADPWSCQHTSWCYRDGACLGPVTVPDYQAALRYKVRACEVEKQVYAMGKPTSDTVGCDSLWQDECLVEPSPCERRCEKGEDRACGWLANMHQHNFGAIKVDPARAIALYRRACDRGSYCAGGYSAACEPYKPDTCIERCENGDANACYWTSQMFREGNSSAHVLRDADRAQSYLAKACRADDKVSSRCATLGKAEAP